MGYIVTINNNNYGVVPQNQNFAIQTTANQFTIAPVIDTSKFITGATNIGGVGLYSSTVNKSLQVKGLQAGNGITLVQSPTGVTINGASVGNYVSASTFNTYSGTTVPLTYESRAAFNAYTASTTNVTTANNGLTKNGNNVRLGGTLTGATNIQLGTNTLTITGSTGKYLMPSTGNFAATGYITTGIQAISGIRAVTASGLDIGQIQGTGGGGYNIRFIDGNYATVYAVFNAVVGCFNTQLTVGNSTSLGAALAVNGAIISSSPTLRLCGAGTTTNYALQAQQSDKSTNILTLKDNGDFQLGLSTSKLGVFGTTAIAQVTTGVTTSSFVQNSGTAINSASTFDGYTLAQLVKAMRNYGLLK